VVALLAELNEVVAMVDAELVAPSAMEVTPSQLLVVVVVVLLLLQLIPVSLLLPLDALSLLPRGGALLVLAEKPSPKASLRDIKSEPSPSGAGERDRERVEG
jgi:hypothetical protein